MTGLRTAVPVLVAGGVWGFVTGIAMVKSGLSESMAVLMTLTVYAGSAQLTSLPLIQAGAPLWLIFLAGCVVNVRFVIFGAALHPYFRHLPWRRRFVVGFLSSDSGFALFMARYGDSRRRGTANQLWYFLGIILPGWFVWNVTSLLGVGMAGFIPDTWSLDFAAILALLAVVVPLVKGRPMLASVLAAAIIAWAAQGLPLRLGLLAAVVGGIVAGVLAERHPAARRRP